MAKQDVRHVDLRSPTQLTDGSTSSSEAYQGDSLAPVVVRVPWLAPKPRPAAAFQGEIRAAGPAAASPRPFQPESFVATMGVASEPVVVDWSMPSAVGAQTYHGQAEGVGQNRHLGLLDGIVPQVATLPQSAPSPNHAPRPLQPEWVGTQGETHFRLDPPQGGPAARSSIEPSLATGQTPWQQQLVVADQFLKDYGRAILLVALLLAAGFVLLVLNSGGTLPIDPVDSSVPSPANRIAPAAPEEMNPSQQLRPIDPPRVAEALGPEGLAIRKDLENAPASESDITPIKPHFEGRSAEPSATSPESEKNELPYPSTDLPPWDGAEQHPSDEDPANVAVIRSVRPTR